MENVKTRGMTKDLTFTCVLIAIGIILPSIFHMFHLGGPIFLPMHIPVIMCGFLVGRKYGLMCGIIVPLLSSVLTGMPPLFPIAITMSLELGTYGYVSGLLSNKVNPYIALIGAQIIGRIVGAMSNFIILGLAAKPFVLSTYLTGVFVTALPGILLQLLLIPAGMMLLKKAGVGKLHG